MGLEIETGAVALNDAVEHPKRQDKRDGNRSNADVARQPGIRPGKSDDQDDQCGHGGEKDRPDDRLRHRTQHQTFLNISAATWVLESGTQISRGALREWASLRGGTRRQATPSASKRSLKTFAT